MFSEQFWAQYASCELSAWVRISYCVNGDAVKLLEKAVAFKSCLFGASYENLDGLVTSKQFHLYLHLATTTLEPIAPKSKFLVVNIVGENSSCTKSYLWEAAGRKYVHLRRAFYVNSTINYKAYFSLPKTKERLHIHEARKKKADPRLILRSTKLEVLHEMSYRNGFKSGVDLLDGVQLDTSGDRL